MNSQIQVIVPEWFVQDELHIIDTIVSQDCAHTGFVIAGENFDASKQCQPTVRIYSMQLIENRYELTKELDAFPFSSAEKAKLFCTQLPKLNALDLIMLMNKEEPVTSV